MCVFSTTTRNCTINKTNITVPGSNNFVPVGIYAPLLYTYILVVDVVHFITTI